MRVVSRLWRMIRGEATGLATEPALPAGPPGPTGPAVAQVPAPPPHESILAEETSQTVADQLDLALDDIFSSGAKASASAPPAGPNAGDQTAIRELFAGIAANYSRPIKDFVFELKNGSARLEWIEICRPVLGSIMDAARSMELAGLVKCLHELDGALAAAQPGEGSAISDASRASILALYDKLHRMQPDAFAIDETSRRRESILIHSLLRQIPDVGYVTIEKLYRVGLTTREALFLAQASELSITAGIPLPLSRRMCDWLQDYRSRTEGASPEELIWQQQARLVQLLQELRDHHEAFKKTCDEVSVAPDLVGKKREARKQREACALEIEVILAEMGEVDLVQQIQRLAFGKRIKKLEKYMDSMPGLALDPPQATTAGNAHQPVGG